MTALVSSSTNSGTPSVLATICRTTPSGRRLPPATAATSAVVALAAEAAQRHKRAVGQARPGRTNSGPAGDEQQDRQARQPLDQQARAARRDGVAPVHVLEDASTGRRAASPSSWRSSAANVRSLRCCGVGRRAAGSRSPPGIDEQLRQERRRPRRGASRPPAPAGASSLASLRLRAVAARRTAAARSSCAMIGWNALWRWYGEQK